MSGIVGHTMYAMLGAKAAAARRLPITSIIERHWASYLAGSYLGCDIQTMPEAICIDTGREVGYGTVPLAKSPITGGAVRPFRLSHGTGQYSPRQIHELFYGRAHLTFGWTPDEESLRVPWDHLADYAAFVVEDTLELFGPGERPLAYVLGWLTHVVGDRLIKSVQPGIDLHLLDGKYTPRNRPIQDLVTFHEVGEGELHVNWRALFADLAATPVEPVQLHYMRVGPPRGTLARFFKDGWVRERPDLLQEVLKENRRYVRRHAQDVLQDLTLRQTPHGRECRPSLSEATGGLSYAEMLQLAEQAGFRHALWQMGEAVADLWAAVVARTPHLQRRDDSAGPTWQELSAKWQRRATR